MHDMEKGEVINGVGEGEREGEREREGEGDRLDVGLRFGFRFGLEHVNMVTFGTCAAIAHSSFCLAQYIEFGSGALKTGV